MPEDPTQSMDLDHVPAEWSDPIEVELSLYAIESVLPEGRRRFLKLRESFLAITNSSLLRAGILECAMFEMGKRFYENPAAKKLRSLEWREEQHDLLLDDPTTTDLWADFPDDLIMSRLFGLASGKSAIAGALNWLEDAGFLQRGKKPGTNHRRIVVDVKKLGRAIEDHPRFAKKGFTGVVSGSPEQLIPEPKKSLFAPLYEELTSAVSEASGEKGPDACRASLVLQRILYRAMVREREGEPVPAVWTQTDLQSTFGFGDRKVWMAALKLLVHSRLVLREGNEVKPNLPVIYAACGTELPQTREVQIPPEGSTDPTKPNSRSPQSEVQIPPGVVPDRPDRPSFIGNEIVEETLTEIANKKELGAGFKPREILDSHSTPIFRTRRTATFSLLPVNERWANLTFEDLASADETQAAVLLQLARQLKSGERSAVCFPRNDDRSRALISVLIGYWIDEHVGDTGADWFNFGDREVLETIKLKFDDGKRKAFVQALKDPDPMCPIVVENLASTRKSEQLRDELYEALEARSNELMPVVFLGMPPNAEALTDAIGSHRLHPMVIKLLTQRLTFFDDESADRTEGTDGRDENPFHRLL